MDVSIKAATNYYPPYINIKNLNNKWEIIGGFEANIVKTIFNYYNISYELIDCGQDYGQQYPNGSWSGVIGQVEQHTADLGFSALSITYDRTKIVDYLKPYAIQVLTYATSEPKQDKNLLLVIKPFESSIWITLFATIFTVITINSLTFKTKYFCNDFNWNIISSIFKQNTTFSSVKYKYLRIFSGLWLLSCVVLDSSYSGCLHSLMSIPSKLNTIDSLEELAKCQREGLVQVVGTESGNDYQFVKQSVSGVLKEIGDYIKPVINIDIGFALLHSDKYYAMITSIDEMQFTIHRHGINSIFIPETNTDTTISIDIRAFPVVKGFKFKYQFNKVISYLFESGIIDHWIGIETQLLDSKISRNLFSENKSIETNRKEAIVIKLSLLRSALGLILVHILISIIIFTFEISSKFLKLLNFHVKSGHKRFDNTPQNTLFSKTLILGFRKNNTTSL